MSSGARATDRRSIRRILGLKEARFCYGRVSPTRAIGLFGLLGLYHPDCLGFEAIDNECPASLQSIAG